MGKICEEKKEFPPLYLETISISEFVNFGNLKKYLVPLWYNSALLSAKKSTAAGADFGAYKYLPNCFSLSPKKKKHDRLFFGRIEDTQKSLKLTDL